MNEHTQGPVSARGINAAAVGTLPECEPDRSFAHFERLAVMMGLPTPDGGWRYLRDVG